MRLALMLVFLSPLLPALDNHITIYEAAGTAQTARPYTVLMFFAQGEFPAGVYAKPRLDGTTIPATWQVDKKSAWPDGSLQQAFVSFPVTLSANGSVTVDFIHDVNPCHLGNLSTCQAAALDQAGMTGFLGGAWDVQIRGTANSITNTVSAKTMIGAGAWRYQLRGPVATRVIAEDMTTALAYDFGWQWDGSAWVAPSNANYKPLHPWFEVSFYPGWSGVEADAWLENPWVTKFQRQVFDFAVLAGGSPSVVYSKSAFTLRARSAAHYVTWSGTAPSDVVVDRNLNYLVYSRLLPPYDTSLVVPSSWITSWMAGATSNLANDDQARPDPNNCTATGDSSKPCTFWDKYQLTTGGRQELAFQPEIYTGALYILSDPTKTVAQKLSVYQSMVVRAGDAAIPATVHFRESDTTYRTGPGYGTKYYFFAPSDTSTPAFGRFLSLNARPTIRLGDYEADGSITAEDRTVWRCAAGQPCESWQLSDHVWVMDGGAHHGSMYAIPYLLTGRYGYLLTLQESISYLLGTGDWRPSGEGVRGGAWGIRYDAGGSYRAVAWSLRELMLAYLLTPDGVERDYFADKVKNNDAAHEGLLNVTDGNHYTVNCEPGGYQRDLSTTLTDATELTGSNRMFGLYWMQAASRKPTISVNGVAKTVGLKGQSGYDFYIFPGAVAIEQDASGTLIQPSDTVSATIREHRQAASPWCIGRGVLGMGVDNPMHNLSINGDTSDKLWSAVYPQSRRNMHGWQYTYGALVYGWFRQTRSLTAAKTYAWDFIAPSYGKFLTDMVLYPGAMYYAGKYNWPVRLPTGVVKNWDEFISVYTPATTLNTAITAASTTILIDSPGGNPTFYTDWRTYPVKIGSEWVLMCRTTAASPVTTFQVCAGGRGMFGTAAAAHSAGEIVDWRSYGWDDGLAGHTYPNIFLNALAVSESQTANGSWRRAYEAILGSGYGISQRANSTSWAIVPRRDPSNVRALVSAGTVTLEYNAPDVGACKTVIAAALPDSSDEADASDGGGAPGRSIRVSGLSAGTYRYRISCGSGRTIGRVTVN